VSSYGGATNYGSLHVTPNSPVVGMAATPDGKGYWLVASDGGVFTFGDANFDGSLGSAVPPQSALGFFSDAGTGEYTIVNTLGVPTSFH
jgi:hypothetical protein